MTEVCIRIGADSWQRIITDLMRPHVHAHERFGLLGSRYSRVSAGWILFPVTYLSMPDKYYVRDPDDPTALIDSRGIIWAMSQARRSGHAFLFVHHHPHLGVPALSGPDMKHGKGLVQALSNANKSAPQGFFALSKNAAAGLVLCGESAPISTRVRTSIIGTKMAVL